MLTFFSLDRCWIGIALLGLLISMTPSIALADDAWQADFSKQTITDDQGASLGYRLLTPEELSSEAESKQQYPLVLFLHGAGERGSDNTAQLKHGVHDFYQRRETNPCFVVVPQCPEEKRWVETDWSEPNGKNTFPEQPSEPMRLAMQVIRDLIAAGNVDPQRVYVTGLSMGGYGTWYAAGLEGHPFAAAAPICGGGDPTWAERYVGLPLWVFHGDADTAVPVGRSREMVEAIRNAGGDVRYTEYEDVGHDSWTRTYKDDDFHQWLFKQQRQ